MDARVVGPATRWAVFAGVVIASGILAFAALHHEIADHRAGSLNPDDWLRAAEEESSNPENGYRLGRYRQLDFEHGDFPLAISYYRRAVAIDPASPYYWTGLADAYEASGNVKEAENAFRAAQKAYPISADVAWRFGNFLMRQNRVDEAFQQIHHAVSEKPDLVPLAVSRCWRSTQDAERILTVALPDTPEVHWGALEFFVKAGDSDATMTAWRHIVADQSSFPLPRIFPAVDLLIQAGRAQDAKHVWEQALSVTKVPPEYNPPGSLIWNGDFETEVLNGGLAWHYHPVSGASVDLDEGEPHSGQRSLRIAFDGTANLDFEDVWQTVVVEPSTRYRFSAYTRTDELTTESGIRFEIRDPFDGNIPPQITANAVGTQPWALDDLEFTTGPRTRILRVTVQRPTSVRLENKIRGTGWIDDVSLTPVARPGAGRP